VRPKLCPQSRIFEDEFDRTRAAAHSRFDTNGRGIKDPAERILTDEEAYLVGWRRDFRGKVCGRPPIVVRNCGEEAPTRPALSAAYRRCEA
jgi:hypothetical protein